MELRHLRYFVIVAEEQNVTRAAAKLHVSQPALSRQIHDLEEELGLALFERSAKMIRLTEPGRIFLEEARAVLLRADEAVATARAAAGGLQGELHVGYAPSLTVEILPRALRAFHAELPGVRVMLHDASTEEMLSGLREGKLHVALIVRPPDCSLSGLHSDDLASYPLCVAMVPTHALAKAKTIRLEKIVTENFVGYSRADYPEYHRSFEALFESVGGKPVIAEEHDSVSSLLAAVEAGRGIALVPSCVECMVGPRLKIIPVTPAPAPIVVAALRREGTVSHAVMRFIAAAQKG